MNTSITRAESKKVNSELLKPHFDLSTGFVDIEKIITELGHLSPQIQLDGSPQRSMKAAKTKQRRLMMHSTTNSILAAKGIYRYCLACMNQNITIELEAIFEIYADALGDNLLYKPMFHFVYSAKESNVQELIKLTDSEYATQLQKMWRFMNKIKSPVSANIIPRIPIDEVRERFNKLTPAQQKKLLKTYNKLGAIINP